MRVLIAHSGNLYGGIETALVALARAAARRRQVDVSVALCFAGGRLAGELREAGAVVHDLGPARMSRPWTVWRARRRLRRVLDSRQVDVALTPSAWAHALFAPVIRAGTVPLALWAHNMWSVDGWLDRRAVASRPDMVVANSRFTAGIMARLFPGVPLGVVYCPLEPPRREPGARARIRQQLATPPDAVVVVQVARLEPNKGHRLLIDALALLPDVPEWRCWFVGGAERPEERHYLQELQLAAQAAGIDRRVQFLGTRADVAQVLDAADLFCHPNVGPESFGLAFVEALAAGLPVVGTSLGGVPEIVTADSGRLVPPGDAPALAAELRTLIESPTLRASLGRTGPARADHLCNPDDRLADLVGLLEPLAGARRC